MAKVKYHFALNDKGQIIDIADVTEATTTNTIALIVETQ